MYSWNHSAAMSAGRIGVIGAALLLAACQESITEPRMETETPPAALAVAGTPRGEPTTCGTAPLALNPPPGWPYLYGTAGDDKLMVTEGWGILYGRAGNDCLMGAGGNDTLLGEAGDDVLHGGAGSDYAQGGPGSDWIRTGAGDDYINVADGEADFVDAGAGEDQVYARDGAPDIINCGAGHDFASVDEIDTVEGCEVVVTS